jgi:CelD/BcsL family acetyltransferase involved in cellulose biosynthesis
MPDDSPYVAEEVTTRARFRETAEEWDALCDRAVESCPTMRHAFLDAWLDTFGRCVSLRVVVVRRESTMLLAAPLVVRTERLLRGDRSVLSTMCNSWVERGLVLAAELDPDLIDAFLSHLRLAAEHLDLVALGPLDAQGPIAQLLSDRAARQGWSVGAEEVLSSPTLRLPSTWEALLGGLSGSSRAAVRRKLLRAEQTPGLQLSVVRDASAWEAIEAISPYTWQAAQGTAMTSTPELRDFYQRIVTDAAHRGTLRCGLLRLEGQPVAFDLNILERGVLYSLKMGFRQEQSALSAGAVLKAFMLRASLADSVDQATIYDFMGVAEPYKLHWTPEVRAYSRLLLFPPGIRPRATYWLHFVARPWLRRHVPRLRARLKHLGGKR